VAYPTDPSQVGLTVAKNTLTLDTRTSITADETITGRYFPNELIITGNTDVSFTDCWFYSGGTNSLRNAGTGTVTVTNCEFGITAAEGYDEGDHLVDVSLSGPNIVCTETYFHHAQDFVRLGDNSTYSRCYMHHHVVTETSHADGVQSTGSVDWSVTDCTVINDYAPDVGLGGDGINRAFHIAPDFSPVTGFTIADNFIDGVGFYSFAVSPLATGSVTGNRFGRGTDSPIYPTTFGPAAHITHSDNRWFDTLESLDGEDEAVASGDIIQVKVFTGDNATSASLAFDSTPTLGNLVVLCLSIRSNTVAQVTGLPGEFTAAVTPQYSTGSTVFNHQMYLVSDGADNSFSVSWTTSASYTMALIEVEGPVASPLDVGNSSDQPVTASTSMATAAVTTTVADTIVIGHIGSRDSHGGISAWSNSYIEIVDSIGFPGAGAPAGMGVAYLVLSATATTSTTATTAISRRWGSTIAAYELLQPPAAPGNPSATADSQTQITVDWDNVADETGYRVERSPDGTGSWVDVSGNLAADTVTYADTGLTCNTQYFYRVYSFNGAGDSAPSTVVNATTDACTPGGGGNRMGGTGAIRKPPRNTRR
jgi:hypothetical protein